MAITPVIPIAPAKAPRTHGPYVHAVRHENTIYTTACIPLDPETGQLINGDFEAMVRRVWDNVIIVLEEAGTTVDRIIKHNIYLTNIEDFTVYNSITEEYLGSHRPARATMQVVALPLASPCGMDVIAAAT